ncbi:MAG: arginine--tRNA ligase [Candidatus Pacebacteria bacterium]|nr:arginine--tRNA ligase [Candidatus Paceibacterota bacterium]
MTVIEQIQKDLNKALEQLGFGSLVDIRVEHPRDMSHGDFATNIAMVLSKQLERPAFDIAKEIQEQLLKENIGYISDIHVAQPGFINITLSQDFFSKEMGAILRNKETYGKNHSWKGKKILVEHSSPNLFKPFHIGHMMNNTIGEAIVRICKTSGADVTAISYPSDVSLGIGKAVWKLLDYGVDTLDQYKTLPEKLKFLGRCYAEGTEALQNHPELESRIREITQDIYEHRDTEAYRAYLVGRDLNLEYFNSMTQQLGSTFDDFIFESEAGIIGKEIIEKNIPQIYSSSQGAVIYEGEKDGLHTRVFINADGNPTYETKDTGLLKLKFDRYHPDLSIFVTDHEQGPYFQVVVSAAGKINSEWKEKTVHKTHGRMKFKGEKMSSRLGNTPLVSDMIDTVIDELVEQNKSRELNRREQEIIAIGALKYTILRVQAGKDINFDPEKSLSFEGDSGPYLQYTYARSRSLLRRAEESQIISSEEVPYSWETTDLERYLSRYPEVLEESFLSLQPHLVVNYVTELAQIFNTWYGQEKIIDTENKESPYKLVLVMATAEVIKNALGVLGIETLEKM